MPDSPAALEVRELRRAYGGRPAADGIDLTAAAGEVTALLGPNGAGKTTTVECCVGLRRPDSGTIRVLGLDRSDPASAAPLREFVGVMLQDGGLPMAPRAGDVLTHVSRMYDRPLDPGELLERLDLTSSARTPVRRLSGGQRQRLALACAVVGRPRLVFLDEPSAGLDPRSRRETWALVRELRSDGVAIVLTTHLMDDAEELADQVVVVDAGTVVATGAPGELAGHSLVDAFAPDGRAGADWARDLAAALAAAGRTDLAEATAPARDGAAARVLLAPGTHGPDAHDVAAVSAAAETTAAEVTGNAAAETAAARASEATRAGGSTGAGDDAAETAASAGPVETATARAGVEIVAGRRTLEDAFLELTGRSLSPSPDPEQADGASPRRRRRSR
ncbi:ABC transporter ATP-binding protein [Georgenia sp. Z1491]|uniref:ABC transporter ATP-binding protein n=1 Tax=Georgenia sp. Z1491 TaxID=3416707 RepID=UPI003CED9C96